jgi:DNA-binding MarR family transcriptional regulator
MLAAMGTAARVSRDDGPSAAVGAPRTVGLFDDGRLAPTDALAEAHIAVVAAMERLAMRPAGLDAATAALLVRLYAAPDCGIRGVRIAELCQMSVTRVSRLVDRAESKGLVARQPDPDDRRAQQVVLTNEGRLFAQRYAPLLDEVVEGIVFAGFTPHERATLVGLLTRVRERALELLAGDSRRQA